MKLSNSKGFEMVRTFRKKTLSHKMSFASRFGISKLTSTDSTAPVLNPLAIIPGTLFPWFTVILILLFISGSTVHAQGDLPAQSKLSTEPQANPSPLHQDKQSATGMVIGVEAITDQSDGTSESFDLVKYLQSHPLELNNATLEVVLIDSPVDTDYAISGTLSGSVTVSWTREFPTSRKLEQLAVAPLAIAATIMLGGGLSYVGTYKYSWLQHGHFVLRRRGRKIAEIDVESQGDQESHDPIPHFRSVAVQDTWRQLSAKILSSL
jgi:hypothetical protein